MLTRRELQNVVQAIYDCQDPKCGLCGACLHLVREALRVPATKVGREYETAPDDPIRTFRPHKHGKG